MSTDQDMMNLLTQGRLASLRRGSVVVNDGTGTPRRRSCSPKGATAAGVEFLDAPVGGGHAGAMAAGRRQG